MSAPGNIYDNAIVTHARVVAHISQDLGGGQSENHWTIYFLLQGGGSVRMNMAANPGIPEGTLEINHYAYQDSTSAVQHWDYSLARGKTFKNILDMVLHYGHERYRFSGGGSGCRYWCFVIMNDLEENGWIHKGSRDNLRPHMNYLYYRNRGPSTVGWVEGSFYN